jgi:hypothetical protein
MKIGPTCSLVPASLLGFLKLHFLKASLQFPLFFLIASKALSNLDNEIDL